MPIPLIGLTLGAQPETSVAGRLSLKESYVRSVIQAGGQPVLIPPGISTASLEVLRQRLDAVILTGGADVEPSLFGGLPHPAIFGIEPERDDLEIELARLAKETDWPLLGICRGIQLMNVAFGGTLYTHIPDQLPGAVEHNLTLPESLAHAVDLEPTSRLAEILRATSIQVNSQHHQGILHLADALAATGYSPDGLVEAVEVPGRRFVLGVQWHPERMPQMLALFRALVEAAVTK